MYIGLGLCYSVLTSIKVYIGLGLRLGFIFHDIIYLDSHHHFEYGLFVRRILNRKREKTSRGV